MTTEANPVPKNTILILSAILLTIGTCCGPLTLRLYFLHGGSRLWLSSFLQTAGWPFSALLLLLLYFHRHHHRPTTTTFIFMGPKLFLAAAIIGVLLGLDDYLLSFGFARLPVSTSTLITASQLVFTSFFAYILVNQKFTAYSINAVVQLTFGAAVLAMHTSGDRPAGESSEDYITGFFVTFFGGVLYGLILPLIELAYNKGKQAITYTLVLEFQMFMSLFATLVCTVGMILNNDFKVISKEATNFELGKTTYYTILCVCLLLFQFTLLGTIGIIFYGSSLLSGIIFATLIPLTEVLAVLFYKEKFQVEKGVALGLSLWGFVSYFYGEYKLTRKPKDLTQSLLDN